MTGRDDAGHAPSSAAVQRLDKWLWCARVVKSRTLAAGLIAGGKVRVNRERALKPAHVVRPGDVVTVVVHTQVRVLRMLARAPRRGPPAEARLLYEELTGGIRTGSAQDPADADMSAAEPGVRVFGAGRPTKRERRHIDRLKGR